jgi:hypothetical protein
VLTHKAISSTQQKPTNLLGTEAMMAGLLVPLLMQKLRLLTAYRHFEDIDQIAREVGVAAGTLRWWATGDAAREAGRISQKNIDAVLAVFAHALPDMPRDKLLSIVRGPLDDLETHLQSGAIITLTQLVEREADHTSGKLFLEERASLGLIETKQVNRRAAQFQMALGKYFRIEFPTNLTGGNLIGLQKAQQAWGMVPCFFGAEQKCIFMPGYDADGALASMCERRDTGLHQFIAIQTDRPIPPEIMAAEIEGVSLDRTILSHVARFLMAQPARSRRIFVMDIDFTTGTSANIDS